MRTETVEIEEAREHFSELVHKAASGVHIVLSEHDNPIAQLLPMGNRFAGLHEGAITTSEDFDEPLPDEFWEDGE